MGLGRHDGTPDILPGPVRACEELLDLECTWVLLRLRAYPPLFSRNNLPWLSWLDKAYQIYQAHKRSVCAINVHAQLVLGQINVVPDRYSVSELESEYADGSEVDHSEEEDEGDRDMFWWLPVPTFPLPVYTKQPYYYPS